MNCGYGNKTKRKQRKILDIRKQSALADIEALDMIKDSICSECDSYLDYSELKDNMCAKCGKVIK